MNYWKCQICLTINILSYKTFLIKGFLWNTCNGWELQNENDKSSKCYLNFWNLKGGVKWSRRWPICGPLVLGRRSSRDPVGYKRLLKIFLLALMIWTIIWMVIVWILQGVSKITEFYRIEHFQICHIYHKSHLSRNGKRFKVLSQNLPAFMLKSKIARFCIRNENSSRRS